MEYLWQAMSVLRSPLLTPYISITILRQILVNTLRSNVIDKFKIDLGALEDFKLKNFLGTQPR